MDDDEADTNGDGATDDEDNERNPTHQLLSILISFQMLQHQELA